MVPILTIVVSYNTDVASLRANLKHLSLLSEIVICDNSTEDAIRNQLKSLAHSENIHYLSMDGNKGIAYAQNRGIELARRLRVDRVLFMDDDSKPAPDMLPVLTAAYDALAGSGERPGSVGAIAVSHQGEIISNARPTVGAVTRCSLMMSSGTMISMAAIEEVGMMEESLFIGFVDFDWGWRARAVGYELYLANDAYFTHSLGVGVKNILGLKLKVPSPIRHYYQFRNTIWLFSKPYVPLFWRIKQIPTLLVRIILFCLFIPPQEKRLSYMLKGLVDGAVGRTGAIRD
jgi:rhamnosyltransferase